MKCPFPEKKLAAKLALAVSNLALHYKKINRPEIGYYQDSWTSSQRL